MTESYADALVNALPIDDHVDCVRAVLARHPLSTEVIGEVEEGLEKVQVRRKDENLYLGVIGEFSSGKSTFMNAVMRDDLLRTDVLQATTAAATWMRYGKKIDVEFELAGGASLAFRGGTIWQRFRALFRQPDASVQKDRFRRYLHELTCAEDVATQIASVTLYHPAAAFARGLVICDTPGANAENRRHAELAAETVVEHCDGAIVIIPADVPVSGTLLAFLRQYLAQTAHRAIFLVTKLDLVKRKRERDRLLKTIEKRIASGLDLERVEVMACAPRVVVDAVTGESDGLSQEERVEWLAQFERVESRIWAVLEANRSLIQAERLLRLISSLFESIPQELYALEQEYRASHDALDRNRIKDLKEYARVRKEKYWAEMRRGAGKEKARATRAVRASRQELTETLKARLRAEVGDFDDLKTYVEAEMPAEFENSQEELQEEIACIFDSVVARAQQQVSKFESEFALEYESLATLGGRVRSGDGGMSVWSESDVQHGFERKAASMARVVKDADAESFGVSMGGAGAGAVIGSLVLPGIGTAVGGAIGWFAGKLFGPSVDDVKKETWKEIEKSIRETFEAAEETVSVAIDDQLRDAEDGISGVIDRYLRKYEVLVTEMIARDEADRQKLDMKRRGIADDLELLRERKRKLAEWQEALKVIHIGGDVHV